MRFKNRLRWWRLLPLLLGLGVIVENQPESWVMGTQYYAFFGLSGSLPEDILIFLEIAFNIYWPVAGCIVYGVPV